MATAAEPVKRRNPLAGMFAAAARPFTFIFPGFVLVTFILSMLFFRISDTGVEIGFAAVLYLLAFFYLGGMLSRKVTIYGLITLFALPVMLYFIDVRTYWPIMAAIIPAIHKAFKERQQKRAGRIVSICLGLFLFLAFIPAALLSCDAYHSERTFVKQAVSPDGRHVVKVHVLDEGVYYDGGLGRADLYDKYPFFLERWDRELAFWDRVPLQHVHRGGYTDTHAVSIAVEWKDDTTVVMGELTMDVHKDPAHLEYVLRYDRMPEWYTTPPGYWWMRW